MPRRFTTKGPTSRRCRHLIWLSVVFSPALGYTFCACYFCCLCWYSVMLSPFLLLGFDFVYFQQVSKQTMKARGIEEKNDWWIGEKTRGKKKRLTIKCVFFSLFVICGSKSSASHNCRAWWKGMSTVCFECECVCVCVRISWRWHTFSIALKIACGSSQSAVLIAQSLMGTLAALPGEYRIHFE